MANKEVGECRERIDKAITEQDWIEAWRNLIELAKSRQDGRAGVDAMKLILAYAYGRPAEKPADKPDLLPVDYELHHDDTGGNQAG